MNENDRRAKVAVDNAIKLECKKDGLRQRQNGDWCLSIVIQPNDMHAVILNAEMGQRFFCTMNELDQNEEPVDHKAIERDKWRALGPTKQAGIRCGDPVFWAWLEEVNSTPCNSNDDAAMFVRQMCDVASRADLGKPGFSEQRTKWYELDNAFQGWRAKENG